MYIGPINLRTLSKAILSCCGVVEQYSTPPPILDVAVRTLAAMSKCFDITLSPRTNRGIDFDARNFIQRTDARLQPFVLVLYQLGLRHDTSTYQSDSYGFIILQTQNRCTESAGGLRAVRTTRQRLIYQLAGVALALPVASFQSTTGLCDTAYPVEAMALDCL
jgi:hypothetical protein